MKNLKVLSALFILSMILTGCKKENVVTKQPSVVSNSPTDITVSSFAYGGDVVEDGQSPVAARGICYATHKQPSLSDKYTSDGSGTGRFSGVIKGLAEGTTYYFRAYATNQVGTSYGELKQLTTKERKKIKGAEQAYSGLESKPTKVKLKGVDINCVEVDGKVFYQGDILIKDSSLRGMGLDYESYRWPENTVYYDIDPSFPRKERIEDAIQLFEATNIKFKKRGNEDNYVYFRYIPDAGCYSYLGMIGGKQDIVIDNWGEAGEIAHEIAHALGLLHEQCKPNRDQYIRVIFENIESGQEGNFEIFNGKSQYDEPFDFGSIMLYHSWCFSKDGELPTITKIDGETFIPQRERLSDADVAILNRLYPKQIYPVFSVMVTPSAKSMTVGDQFQLSVTIFPENATNKTVSYTSGDKDVVTVDASGKITAVRPGKTTVSVITEDGGKSATCTVTVMNKVIAVEGVTLSPTSKSVAVGDSFQLSVKVLPSNATNQNVTYRSSNVDIVRVNSSGRVTAIKVGESTVTVSTEDGGKTASCNITVIPKAIAVEKVVLTPQAKTLIEGESFQLTATIHPANASNKSVTYTSSDDNIASVDASGKVVAIKAGKAVITVITEDGSKTATCDVSVESRIVPVEEVIITPKSKILIVGETFQLKSTVLPANATNKDVTYKSSDVGIVNVDQSGKIKALKAGKATITVITKDGGKTAVCEVTVDTTSNGGGGRLPDVGGDIFRKP